MIQAVLILGFGALFLIAMIYIFVVSIASYFSFAPYVPTKQKDLAFIAQLAGLQPGMVAIDLGCGDARVARYLAAHSEAKVLGIEIARHWVLFGKLVALFYPNLEIRFHNMYTLDISDADLVYIYGYPKSNAGRVKKKFESEMKPGSRVFSYVFEIPGWTPDRVEKTPAGKKIYVYTM